MPRTRGANLVINLSAGTTQLIMDFEKAKGTVKNFQTQVEGGARGIKSMGEASHEAVTGVQAVSGALRVLEGGVTNNLRAAERFTANVLGLGPLLQRAFPVIGAIAFAGILAKLGEEVATFYATLRDGPEKMRGSFEALTAGARMANDTLDLSNAKLDQQIAKLEGKRQNTLAIMLNEARVMADRLGESLDKALEGLNKVLEENKSTLLQQVFGRISDKGLREELGGKTGFGGFRAEIRTATEEGRTKVEEANKRGDVKGANEAVDKMSADLATHFDSMLNAIDQQIKAATREKPVLGNKSQFQQDSDLRAYNASLAFVEELKFARSAVAEEAANVPKMVEQYRKTGKVAELEAARGNAKLENPYINKIEELQAQVAESKARLSAVSGTSTAERIRAEAEATADKYLQQMNQQQRRENPNLPEISKDSAEYREIFNLRAQEEKNNAETTWQAKLRETSATLAAQTQEYAKLADAIGKGYEVRRKAEVDVETFKKFGADRLNDFSFMQSEEGRAAYAKMRGEVEKEYDARQLVDVKKVNDELTTRIEVLRSIAEAEGLGKWAAKRAELVHQLEEVKKLYGDSAEAVKQLQLVQEKFDAEQAQGAGTRLADLKQQLINYKLLEAAQFSGPRAARDVNFENDLVARRRNNELTDEEEKKLRAEYALKKQVEIGEAVEKRIHYYSEERDKLKEQAEYLRNNVSQYKNLVEVSRVLLDLHDADLRLAAQQAIQLGHAKDGIRAFFLEMQTQAEKMSQILYDSLNKAVEGVSDSLSKAMTGQAASWGKMFQNIGQEMVKQTVKAQIQTGLGRIGNALGIKLPGATPDGSSEKMALWVRIAYLSGLGTLGSGISGVRKTMGGLPLDNIFLGPHTTPNGTTWQDGMGSGELKTPTTSKSGIGGIISSIGSFIIGLASGGSKGSGGTNVSGARAGGGDVSAGSAYLVGERGAEVFVPRASGSIVSNANLRGLSAPSAVHMYSIDARGTDPLLVEQRVKAAIVAAHDSAIGTSIRATKDSMRRSPAPLRA